MYKHMQYQDEAHTIIRADKQDGSFDILEPISGAAWDIALSGALGDIAAYVPPPEPTEAELLAAERDAMRCSTAQMALAMLDAGVDDAIFADDPKAMIIWTKATHISRRGPILDAMIAAMGDEAVDDLFRAAMNTRI